MGADEFFRRWVVDYPHGVTLHADHFVDIRKFGAVPGGSAAVNTPAVQAAVSSGEPIYAAPGEYQLNAPITWDPMQTRLVLHGAPGREQQSKFVQVFTSAEGEAMFHRAGMYMKADGTYYNTIQQGNQGNPEYEQDPPMGMGINIQNIQFYGGTNDDYSHCLDIAGCNGSYIANCYFTYAYRGLTIGSVNFDTAVTNCYFYGVFHDRHPWPASRELAKKAWGLYTTQHKFLRGISVHNSGTGIYLSGVGTTLIGARCENNNYGIILGGIEYKARGPVVHAVQASQITGVSLEHNTIGFASYGASSQTTVNNILIQGQPAVHAFPDCEIGIDIQAAGEGFTLSNVTAGGFFKVAAIRNLSRKAVFMCGGSASAGGGTLTSGATTPLAKSQHDSLRYTFLNTPVFNRAVDLRHLTLTAFHDLMLPGLTGLNISNMAASGTAQGGPVFAKNLGGLQAVSNGASTQAVTFLPDVDLVNGHVGFSSIAAVADGASTLPAGTYYYASTIVMQHGEVGVDYTNPDYHNYKTVVVPAGHRVDLAIHGNGVGSISKRRIYRGTVVGVFDGYFELPGTTNSFSDRGEAFTEPYGAPPPHAAVLPSRVEDDANYQIVATPSWATTVHVTNKTTTGFTLNFGTTAPDANQSVAWLLFRP